MFIDPVTPESAEGVLAEIYESEKERWGFLPTFVQAFSYHPEAYRAWQKLVGTLYGGMDRRRCELATLAAARVLKSTSCSVAHGKMLRDNFFTAGEVARIATDHNNAGLDSLDVEIIDFAEKVARDPSAITQDDVDRLKTNGLTDRDIFDIVFAVAARAFFATVIEALGTRAEKPLAEDLEPELLELLTVGRPVT